MVELVGMLRRGVVVVCVLLNCFVHPESVAEELPRGIVERFGAKSNASALKRCVMAEGLSPSRTRGTAVTSHRRHAVTARRASGCATEGTELVRLRGFSQHVRSLGLSCNGRFVVTSAKGSLRC